MRVHAFSPILIFIVVPLVHGTFYLMDYNIPVLDLNSFPTQDGEELDIIWRYSHSIQLETLEFELNGQRGDFLLISEVPLTFEEYFDESNGTLPPPFLSDSIVTTQGLLLSWTIPEGRLFQALSNFGCFLYLHIESFSFQKLVAFVENLDILRIEPTPKPTEGTLPEVVPLYITKFLACNPPLKFAKEKDLFKAAIAEVATNYCREDPKCSNDLGEDPDLNITDINIPTTGGLHFCDPLWPVFDECVEVTFAISRTINGSETFLMPSNRLEDMWNVKQDDIRRRGYCPYDPPKTPGINTWMWMAAILSITLFLTASLCLIWIANDHKPTTFDEIRKTEGSAKSSLKQDDLDTNVTRKDIQNPFQGFLEKVQKGLDQKNRNNGYEQSHVVAESSISSLWTPQPKTTVNKMFEVNNVEFDNHGFEGDLSRPGSVGSRQTVGEESLLRTDETSDTET